MFDDVPDALTDRNLGKETNMYGAPDVAAHDPRGRNADILSLGCAFLELLTSGCGIQLNEFAAFTGLSGGQAYHSDSGMLNPDPPKRIHMEDLVRWMCAIGTISNHEEARGSANVWAQQWLVNSGRIV